MAERVRVDPIDLHMSSAHMDMRHAELSAAHIAANGAIEEWHVGGALAGQVRRVAGRHHEARR
jgi:hypothetical protein